MKVRWTPSICCVTNVERIPERESASYYALVECQHGLDTSVGKDTQDPRGYFTGIVHHDADGGWAPGVV